jgi:hypothetical protein
MKTYIVLIQIENNLDARKQCEDMENLIFQIPNSNCINVRNKIVETIDDDYIPYLEVEAITDFMDRVNNDEFDSDLYFMTYVHTISFHA